jgi:hypothetical protein
MSRRYLDGAPTRYVSNHKEFTLRGTAPEIVTNYEGLAYQALREERRADAHSLFQQAEHYKRIQLGEVE